MTINCQRYFSESCQRYNLAQNINTTASLNCLLCSLLSHFQLTNDKMVLECHLIIKPSDYKIWFKETHAYKQKLSEHQLIGIHTIWQTYFPLNVSTFDMHNFWVPHPEVGIIDRTLFTKNIVCPDFLLQTTVSTSELNCDQDKIEFMLTS